MIRIPFLIPKIGTRFSLDRGTPSSACAEVPLGRVKFHNYLSPPDKGDLGGLK